MVQRLTPTKFRSSKPVPPRKWVWPLPGLYDGVLFADQNSATLGARIEPILDHVSETYDTPVGLIVFFHKPIVLDADTLGPALPLQKTTSGGLSSYPDALPPPRDVLTCFLAGQHRRIHRNDWVAVDVMQFWDLDGLAAFTATSMPTQSLDLPVVHKATPVKSVITTLEASSPLQDIRDQISKGATFEPNGVKRVGDLALRLTVTVAVLGIALVAVFVLILFTIVTGASGGFAWLLPAFFLVVVLNLLFRVIGFPTTRILKPGGGGETRNVFGRRAEPKYRTPGLIDKLNSWMIWNTSAGNKLRRGLDDRMKKIDRLLQDGKIDEALKRAFSVAKSGEKTKQPMASRMPEIRSALDLNFGAKPSGGTIPFRGAAFQEMRARYKKLADECEQKGDFKRAAFILDELLGDHLNAVRVLESVKQFEDAAKLAMARDLAGGEIVRLWYLAGKRDIAIALAERYSSFDILVTNAEHKSLEAGHFIRKIWAERLAQSGDVLAALQVTDTVANFDEPRLQWLAKAVGDGGLQTPEILHRAVILFPWNTEVLAGGPSGDPNTVGGAVETHLAQLMNPSSEAASRQALLQHVCNFAQTTKDKSFFTSPRGVLLNDILIRQVLSDGVPLTRKTLEQFSAVARQCDLNVLAADLHKIQRADPKAIPKTDQALRLPERAADQPKWQHVTCLPHGRILLGDGDGVLRIVGQNGQLEWGDHVTDLAGFVRVRSGRHVLIILGSADAPRRIVRLDTLHHRYTPLGRLVLDAWHSDCNEQVWLVKASTRIQALSVPSLLGDAPDFTESWGVTITEDVVMNQFIHNKNNVGWYMQRRLGPDQYGLIEFWTASTTNLKFHAYLIAPPSKSDMSTAYIHKTAIQSGMVGAEEPFIGRHIGGILSYSWQQEQDISSTHRRFFQSLTKPAPIRYCGTGPLVVDEAGSSIPLVRLTWAQGKARIVLDGTTWRASGHSHDDTHIAIIEKDHRVVVVDLEKQGMRLVG
ncbi:MAG: hypothetical protein ABJL99_11415 [Aliishimia sp.]